jgi:hypothetical protein
MTSISSSTVLPYQATAQLKPNNPVTPTASPVAPPPVTSTQSSNTATDGDGDNDKSQPGKIDTYA